MNKININSAITGFASKTFTRFTKGALFAGAIALALGTGSHHASAANGQMAASNNIQTIYHVYAGENPLGTVNDKSEINKLTSDMLAKAKEKDPDYDYVLSQDVTLIPEKVFQASTNDKEVITKLKDAIKVRVKAAEIKVGDQTVGFVKDQKAADKVLQKFKEQYISEKAMKKFEEQKKDSDGESKNDKPNSDQLEDGILSIELSDDFNTQESKTTRDKLSRVDDMVDLLSHGNLVKDEYNVKEGDALSNIADHFNLSMDELHNLNPKIKEDGILHVGDTIIVKKPKPYLKIKVVKNETREYKIDFDRDVKKNDDMYKGDEKVLQKGKTGKRRVTSRIILENGHIADKKTLKEKILSEPKKEIIEKGTRVVPSRGSGQLAWPAVGGVITSKMGKRWGEFHKGIDISGVTDRSILAADNGTVTSAGWDDGGYGNRVVINHNNGMKTTYNHMASITVHKGQVVKKGQQVGIMGSTGDSTGRHLHFEVYKDGNLVNPENYLP
ncbi:murein DD-endopeptidase MepM/ murein hydrolase activator NlpD [Scopulibacillus darangshiensis]|uniref:Murein DD-endopeptidase MepM/ murein hydrolase activator NlpD n=1 Tax=Scopulibacillus darangshiensis TaxID=442528 RepID=A0A4R2NPZ5_9BACL|nr:M23 family metallopeptidase [Scopulibacillus darangshiensis]TCP23438.1 murein DD-endopeptidase MepM/ murein hydrolase activator NlpD [Scopulibacillus darangshiensis]